MAVDGLNAFHTILNQAYDVLCNSICFYYHVIVIYDLVVLVVVVRVSSVLFMSCLFHCFLLFRQNRTLLYIYILTFDDAYIVYMLMQLFCIFGNFFETFGNFFGTFSEFVWNFIGTFLSLSENSCWNYPFF